MIQKQICWLFFRCANHQAISLILRFITVTLALPACAASGDVWLASLFHRFLTFNFKLIALLPLAYVIIICSHTVEAIFESIIGLRPNNHNTDEALQYNYIL
jgi:hypothetical protein